MKATRNLIKIAMVVLAGTVIFWACSKEDSLQTKNVPAGKQELNLYLTDGPFDLFDSVLIDIRSVKVLIDTCDKSRRWRDTTGNDSTKNCYVWDSLSIAPGVYDLLSLRNGIDTLLASGVVPDGRIKKIRIELGTNNVLVKDSVRYPLNLGNNSTIVIKLYGHEWDEYQSGRYRLWLDFDVSRSIIKVRDGEFYLRPFIRAFIVKATGGVKGKITPFDAFPVITVFNATDTAYAIPFFDGRFKVRGLDDGTYSVFVNASNGYQDTTITNVSVQVGKEADLGTITLHK